MPYAQDTEAYFAVLVQIWVDALAVVLNELDLWRDQWVVFRDVELQLYKFVLVL